jgi:PAS domain S-box-containing protein
MNAPHPYSRPHMTDTLAILVIEDDQADRELLGLFLESSGLSCQITFTDNKEDLRAHLSNSRWDAVVCDHRLPSFTSNDVLTLVGKMRRAPPIIVVSGNIGESAAVQLLLDGASDVVQKDRLGRLGPAISRAITSVELRAATEEAQLALKDSENRFRTLTELAPVGIYLTNIGQQVMYANERFRQITGLSAEQTTGRDWRIALRIEDDAAAYQATEAFASAHDTPLDFETRIVRPDGRVTWIIGQMLAQYDEDEQLTGHIGVLTDISERKRAEIDLVTSEQRLRDLSSHIFLIEEEQRATIAREIHDDIGSSLTGLQMDVAWLKRELADIAATRPEIASRFDDLQRLIKDTGSISRRIAKALRPSILDQGIVPAIQWLALEHERRYGVRCEFAPPDNEPVLDDRISISLFRVVQEALTNIAKHAAATEIEIVLFVRSRELTLEIRDNGRGLQKVRSDSEGGFGLLGMRERIQSIGGWMEVDSLLGRGVTVMIGVPYKPARQAVAQK